jgi:hypothetical protein
VDGKSYWWVKETFLARKVIIPTPILLEKFGIVGLTVWISKPKRAPKPKHAYDWTGSFLYLPTLHFDGGKTYCAISGCSALQFIVNATNNSPLLTGDPDEPFGRGNRLHPIEKLSKLGAFVSDERQLESLYYVRYITDEQVHTPNGFPIRVNDVVGYPIYISAYPPIKRKRTELVSMNSYPDSQSNEFFYGDPSEA